jgi:hypothetical protein
LSKRPTTKTPTKPDAEARPEDTQVLEAEPLSGGDGWPQAERASLPTRPGLRGMLTPLRVGLLCLLIAVAGFIAGVLVQKGSSGSSSSNPFGSGGLPNLGSGGGSQGGGLAAAFGGGTRGTVSTVDHGTLYVSDAQGNTFKVLTSGATKVTRSAEAKPREIHPGDTVVIQGQKRKNGTVKAQSISATAAGASSGFPGGAALGGGSSSSSGGSSASSGGGSSAVNQLFGN